MRPGGDLEGDGGAGAAAGADGAQAAKGSGEPGDVPKRGADLVREALTRARAAARDLEGERARHTRKVARAARAEPSRGRNDDPVAFGAALGDLVAERGWESTLSSAGVLSRWDVLAGPEVAAHCAPVSLSDGELVLEAESSAWATQLRLLSRQLLTRLQQEVGSDVVSRISVRGPSGPSWKHGRLRVPGRGPRDTYG